MLMFTSDREIYTCDSMAPIAKCFLSLTSERSGQSVLPWEVR